MTISTTYFKFRFVKKGRKIKYQKYTTEEKVRTLEMLPYWSTLTRLKKNLSYRIWVKHTHLFYSVNMRFWNFNFNKINIKYHQASGKYLYYNFAINNLMVSIIYRDLKLIVRGHTERARAIEYQTQLAILKHLIMNKVHIISINAYKKTALFDLNGALSLSPSSQSLQVSIHFLPLSICWETFCLSPLQFRSLFSHPQT